jgi:hypothetical protein
VTIMPMVVGVNLPPAVAMGRGEGLIPSVRLLPPGLSLDARI